MKIAIVGTGAVGTSIGAALPLTDISIEKDRCITVGNSSTA